MIELLNFNRGEEESAPTIGVGLIRFPSDKIAPIILFSFSPIVAFTIVLWDVDALEGCSVNTFANDCNDLTEFSRL